MTSLSAFSIALLSFGAIANSPVPELGEIWTTKQEDEARVVADETLGLLKKMTEAKDFVRRDAHPKTHGCVTATLKIDTKNLKPSNRAGLFAQDGEYDSWIRFSNGKQGGANTSDLESDVRGIAIKLMNVKGTPKGSYDLLMANNREFFAEDGHDYQKLVTALRKGGLSMAAYSALNPYNISRVLKASIKMSSPLEQEYNSAVPYKLGGQSMRLRLVPVSKSNSGIPDKGDNYLAQRVASTLSQQKVDYTFYVQPNNDPKNNPIEDPRKEWNEETSPLIEVGKLTIHQQNNIHSPERVNFCENISFTPWNTLPGSRPLGQINRIRQIVYQEISRFRHERNRTLEVEPTNFKPCEGPAKALCVDPKL